MLIAQRNPGAQTLYWKRSFDMLEDHTLGRTANLYICMERFRLAFHAHAGHAGCYRKNCRAVRDDERLWLRWRAGLGLSLSDCERDTNAQKKNEQRIQQCSHGLF